MGNKNIEEIRRLAQAFRKGIENAVDSGNISPKITKSSMPYFPRGCCDITSDLLAEYLLKNGIHTKSVHGEYDYDNWEGKYPHTWLETENGIIIDITADQFSKDEVFKTYTFVPCYVGTDRTFYSLFTEHYWKEEFRGLENYEGNFYRRNIASLYDIILNHIS